MASLSPSYLINVMSQFGVSILGVSLRHIDVAFLGVSRHVMGDGGTDVSDAGSFQFVLQWRRQRGHQRRRFVSTFCLAMATATWTSATQVHFNSVCDGNVDVSDAVLSVYGSLSNGPHLSFHGNGASHYRLPTYLHLLSHFYIINSLKHRIITIIRYLKYKF